MKIFRVIVREEWKLCLRCCRMFNIIQTPYFIRYKGNIEYFVHKDCPPLKHDLLEKK